MFSPKGPDDESVGGARWSWVPIAVAVLVWVTLLVKGVRKLFKGDGNDFTILHAVGRRLLDGEPLYDGAFMYPPLFAFLMAPIALLPVSVAGILWLLGKIAVVHGCAFALVRRLDFPTHWRRPVVILAPLIIYRFLDSDCATGNVNVYLLGGAVLSLEVLLRGREWWGGVLFATVATVKLAPAYLLGCLALGRRFDGRGSGWRVTAYASVALIVLMTVPGRFVHTEEGATRGFLRTTKNIMSPLDAGEAGTGYVPGQSIRALVHRLARESDATAHDDRYVSINWFHASAATSENIYRGIAIVVGLIGLALSWRGDPLWILGWGSTFLLIVGPYSRKAHFVLLLPAYLLLLAYASRSKLVMASFVTSWILAEMSTRVFWGKAGTAVWLAYCTIGFAAAALLPGLWRVKKLRNNQTTGPIDSGTESSELRKAEA